MDAAENLAHLRRELDDFAACLDADLSTPVVHCGEWTLYDLAAHVGRSSLWSAAAVTEKRGDHRSPRPSKDPAELRAWFAECVTTLLDALDTDPATEAWTFFPPHSAAFWQRRRVHETLIHRWDAQYAVGRLGPIDPAVAADGVAEVVDTMLPFQVQRGQLPPLELSVELAATDGPTLVIGAGDPVATVAGPAADLMLLLWKRLPAGAPSLAWSGDTAAAQALLAAPLTP